MKDMKAKMQDKVAKVMREYKAGKLKSSSGDKVASREQAVAYMADRLSLSRETIEGEVDRYAALPAQALGYQIGNLKLRDLRRRAEAQLGPRFRHRDFHAAVMSAGAVTLPVLDDLVSDWLQRQAGEASHAA